MATYTVTTSNWNDPAFWSALNIVAGDTLDFSGLSGGYTVTSSAFSNTITIFDGATTFVVGGAGYSGTSDANFASGNVLDLGTYAGSDGDDAITTGSGNETIDAGAGDDNVSAGSGADSISGGSGNDTLSGGSGNDNIAGGSGSDVITGGSGDDLIDGGTGADTIDGGSGRDTIEFYDGFGNDTVSGGSGGDDVDRLDFTNLTGPVTVTYSDIDRGTVTDGTDTVTFNEIEEIYTTTHDDVVNASFFAVGTGITVYTEGGDDTVTGSTADDRIHAGVGDDLVFSGDGADTVFTGGGVDTVWGGEGNDELYGWYVSSTVALHGEDGDDVVQGSNAGDTLTGGAGSDSLEGYGDAVSLDGGSGDDSIVHFEGAASIWGGSGADTISAGDDADTIFVEDGFGNDTIVGGEGVSSGTDEDVIDLSGLSGSVTVTYTADEAGTITDGIDTITFSQIEHVILTDQADSVDASLDNSGASIDGMAGNDTIRGGDGADTIDGGADHDLIYGGAGADSITDATGWSTIYAGIGADTVITGTGNDFISLADISDPVVDADADSVDAGAGNDTIVGSFGNDTIDGGDGRDLYNQSSRGDDLTIDLSTNSATIGADTQSILNFEDVEGGFGSDTLIGDAGDNWLFGDQGDDSITGGAGNDTLDGGAGDDVLTGGAGNDIFEYQVGWGADTITDFNAGNTGTLDDLDNTNNDFINLSGFYDNLSQLQADFDDDGVLNQSNATDTEGRAVDYSDNTQFGAGDSLTIQSGTADPVAFSEENTGVAPCFASGTLILTEKGYVPVEALRPGDKIMTRDNGPKPLLLVTNRFVTPSELQACPNWRPIEVKPGLLQLEKPLIVSPQHCLLIEVNGCERLVRARQLTKIQGARARVMYGVRRVTYWHLLFEQHEIIYANGCPTESFLPGERSLASLSTKSRAKMLNLFPDMRKSLRSNTRSSGWLPARPFSSMQALKCIALR